MEDKSGNGIKNHETVTIDNKIPNFIFYYEALRSIETKTTSDVTPKVLSIVKISPEYKKEYIQRVQSDFGKSEAEANQLWNKFMNPLGQVETREKKTKEPKQNEQVNQMKKRQEIILNKVKALEKRVELLTYRTVIN